MDVIEKAHQLAEALAASEELLRFRDAEAKLLNHPEAQNKLQEIIKLGIYNGENIEDPLVREYLAAYRSFYNLLEAVKFILNGVYEGNLEKKEGCCHGCCNRFSLH